MWGPSLVGTEQPSCVAKGSARLWAVQNPLPLSYLLPPPPPTTVDWARRGSNLKLAAKCWGPVHVTLGQGPLLGFERPLCRGLASFLVSSQTPFQPLRSSTQASTSHPSFHLVFYPLAHASFSRQPAWVFPGLSGLGALLGASPRGKRICTCPSVCQGPLQANRERVPHCWGRLECCGSSSSGTRPGSESPPVLRAGLPWLMGGLGHQCSIFYISKVGMAS